MDAKAAAREAIESRHAALVDLSHRIHAHPELAFEEEKASAWCAEALVDAGFEVEKPFCGLPTAFRAQAGSGPLHVAICAEYDALPGIGHACGHNLIATMALGAAMAAARVADDVGLTVTVIGTPAEEHGGGKIVLLDRGAFEGQHFAMMVHPAPIDAVEFPAIACCNLEVGYTGKSAHAAAFPHLGVNALDALTIAQTSIGLLRQHIDPSDRVHGIVLHGGDAPNVVPARTTARWLVRSRTLDRLNGLLPRVRNCFEAGALATGAKLDLVASAPYAEMRSEAALDALYARNATGLGRSFPDLGGAAAAFAGSTDMGNVSLALPSIHPLIGIDSLPAVPHQPEFTAAARTPSADRAVFDGGLSMAWTAIDVAIDDALRAKFLRA